MVESASEARTGVDWMRVLGLIEQTLKQSLTLATELPASSGEPSAPPGALRQLDERLARWQARWTQAENTAAQTDQVLEAEALALGAWLDELGKAREQVAKQLLSKPEA
jgi:hypothetical protein